MVKSRKFRVNKERSSTPNPSNMISRKLREENKQLRQDKKNRMVEYAALKLKLATLKKQNQKLELENSKLLELLDNIYYNQNVFNILEQQDEKFYNIKRSKQKSF